MTKILEALLTVRARAMVRPRPSQSVLPFILMLMGVLELTTPRAGYNDNLLLDGEQIGLFRNAT